MALYNELFESISITATGWNSKTLSGPPASSVVEIALVNSNTGDYVTLGAREVGSSQDRSIMLHEAEGGGVNVVKFTVNLNSSKQLQIYASTTTGVSAYCLGYWESGTYVELAPTAHSTLTSDSWVTETFSECDASSLAEVILANVNKNSEVEAGLRSMSSSLERIFLLHEREPGSSDEVTTLTLFVELDSSKQAKIWTDTGTDAEFRTIGYWTSPPGTWTERFAEVDSEVVSGWNDHDLSGLATDGAVVEMVCAVLTEGSNQIVGARTNGSSLGRSFNMDEAEGGGISCFSCSTLTDSGGVLELYQNNSKSIRVYTVSGEFVSEATEYQYTGNIPLSLLPNAPTGTLHRKYTGSIPLALLPDSPTGKMEFPFSGSIPLTLVPSSPTGKMEFPYVGSIPLSLLPNAPEGLMEFPFSGSIPLSLLPDSPTGILDRVYSGSIPLTLLPNAPEGEVIYPTYLGSIPLTLVPQSDYGLAVIYQYAGSVPLSLLPSSPTGLVEFAFPGSIPLSLLPSSPTGVLDRVYSGSIPLSLLPDSPTGEVVYPTYLGSIPLTLTPEGTYGMSVVYQYTGSVPLSLLPSAPTGILDRTYAGSIPLVLLPDSPEGLMEFPFSGSIPLSLVPSGTYSKGTRDYSGSIPLSLLPSAPEGILDRTYDGSIPLTLLPESSYGVIYQFTGSIPLSLTPSSSFEMSIGARFPIIHKTTKGYGIIEVQIGRRTFKVKKDTDTFETQKGG